MEVLNSEKRAAIMLHQRSLTTTNHPFEHHHGLQFANKQLTFVTKKWLLTCMMNGLKSYHLAVHADLNKSDLPQLEQQYQQA